MCIRDRTWRRYAAAGRRVRGQQQVPEVAGRSRKARTAASDSGRTVQCTQRLVSYTHLDVYKRQRLDRMLFTSMSYPSDYGYIEDTLGEDGDPLDACVLLDEPTFPGLSLIHI